MILSKRTGLQVGLGVLLAVGILAAAFSLNHNADASAPETPVPTPLVSAVTAPSAPPTASPAYSAPAPAPALVAKATGNLASANQATLAFQTAGRVKEIMIGQGQRVKAGDVIATLDTAALDAQVTQAQAALDSATAALTRVKAGPTVDDVAVAKSNVDRAKATLNQTQAAYDKIGGAGNPNIASSQQALALQDAYSAYQAAIAQYHLTVDHPTDAELKAAQAAVAQAQAELQTAKLNAANARITAPFDGTVVWVGPKIGESVVPGTAAVTLADLPHMQVQVNVDEISGASIQVGQPVSITLDAIPGKVLTGHVSQTGLLATVSGSVVSIPVTIDIDPTNMPIYPGLSATVDFQGQNQ
jgi:multidrug efflux pump subunit AcrA (membrane-fusion protein)